LKGIAGITKPPAREPGRLSPRARSAYGTPSARWLYTIISGFTGWWSPERICRWSNIPLVKTRQKAFILMKWKNIIKKKLGKIGYEICNRSRIDKEYTICFPFGYYTYSPWFEDWFLEIYSKIKDYTVVREDRCYFIHKLCLYCSHLEGDFAECGVYKGGTAFLISYTLKNYSKQSNKLHLFDTFTGMPVIDSEDTSKHSKGDFGGVSLNQVKNYIKDYPFVVFHPGLIPETFKEVKDRKFSFVHIDVDLYQTTRDCCSFFYDRMIRGGVMVFDDYGFPRYELAERKAVDEFFNDKPEIPVCLRTGQCFVIKL